MSAVDLAKEWLKYSKSDLSTAKNSVVLAQKIYEFCYNALFTK
jgi:hypothetical protein